jgi:hypothetical protein
LDRTLLVTPALRNLGDLLIWLGAVATAALALGTVGHFLVVRPLRRWIKEQIGVPIQATAKSLETSNGKTAGRFIEDSAGTLDEMKSELHQIRGELRATNNLAIQTNTLAIENSILIDRHTREHRNYGDHGGVGDARGHTG